MSTLMLLDYYAEFMYTCTIYVYVAGQLYSVYMNEFSIMIKKSGWPGWIHKVS